MCIAQDEFLVADGVCLGFLSRVPTQMNNATSDLGELVWPQWFARHQFVSNHSRFLGFSIARNPMS